MKGIYKVKVCGSTIQWMVEVVAESERDARLHAAHAHRTSIRSAKLIEIINDHYDGDFYINSKRI